MKSEQALSELQQVAVRLGIEVRNHEGDFQGGLCRIGTRWVLMLNRSLSAPAKVRILCRELVRLDLSTVFMRPALRELLEEGPPQEMH